MHAGVVELDALSDAVGAGAEDEHLGALALREHLRLGVRVGLVGGVVVGRGRGELGGTGVHRLVHGAHPQPVTQRADFLLPGQIAAQRGDLAVGQSCALGPPQQRLVQRRRAEDLSAQLDEPGDLVNEPWVDPGGHRDLPDAGTQPQRPLHRVQPAVVPGAQRVQSRLHRQAVQVRGGPKPGRGGLHRSQCLAERLGEAPADRHGLAGALHGGGQRHVGIGELLEGEPGHLDHDVIQGRLEAGRRLAGDVVADLVQRVADGQLRGDLGDGEPGRLRRQRARPRHPGVHLDDHQPPGAGVDGELYVAATGVYAHRSQHRDPDVAHALVLAVGQRHRRGHGHGVARVHTHGVDVLDRAHHDHVVRPIAHQL